MNLNLTKPLLFFDLETTGLNIVTDRIVEICAMKVHPDGRREIKTRRINPTIPIPEEASLVHGIKDEDVANEPKFREIAKSLAQWMTGCDIAGYNSSKFDIPLLAEEFLRAGVDFDFRKCRHIDVQTIYHKLEQRTLKAAYKFYCEKELDNAHSAQADTEATFEVLDAQVGKYTEDLQNNVDFLAQFSTRTRNVDFAGRMVCNEKEEVIFNFGKYKGQKVEEVLTRDPSYYDWIIKSDFSLDTKRRLTEIRLSMKLKPQES